MFAVLRTGGKQYKVAPGDVIAVEKLAGSPGDKVTLGDVLLVQKEGLAIGVPAVKDVAVTVEIVRQKRDDKVLIFKKKRRHNYRRKKGHRQYLTELRIVDIGGEGVAAAPAKKARAKKIETEGE